MKIQTTTEIEKAICFLVTEYQRSGHNSKPVILHSLKIAFYLMQNNYSEEIIIAAILHDLIEDSDVISEMIRKEFGEKVSKLVNSLTFTDRTTNLIEMHENICDQINQMPHDALIIKAADLLDNVAYYYNTSAEMKEYLISNLKYFIKYSQSKIGNEVVWQELQNLCRSLFNWK